MGFFLAMSIFTSAADIAHENAKAQEWMRRAWVTRDVDNKSAATERGPQQRQNEAQVQQGRLWFALEFDGLNCFETIAVKQGEQQLLQDEQRAQRLSRMEGKKLKRGLWFAPEFDGINCLETVIHNKSTKVEQREQLQLQEEPRAQQVSGAQGKKVQGRLWFAPEFDGLNCFETIIDSKGAVVEQGV